MRRTFHLRSCVFEAWCGACLQAVFLGVMVRKMLYAMLDNTHIDDRDYYGNKRLELAGGLMAILFEDLWKRFIEELQKDVRLSWGAK